MKTFTAGDVSGSQTLTDSDHLYPVHINELRVALNDLALFNVKDYGALGDGLTDDTLSIQATLNAANTAGGGRVYFPAGTYITMTLTLYSYIWILGDGSPASTIRLKDSTNNDLLKSYEYDSLTGTNDTGGINHFYISDIRLDGNSANNTTGDGLKIYGYKYGLTDLEIRYFKGNGITSEWSTSLTSSDYAMEAFIDKVFVQECLTNGIVWAGPHDSIFSNINIVYCSGKGLWTKPLANITASNVHVWGDNTHSIYLEGTMWGTNIFAEGATTSCITLLVNDVMITNAYLFNYGNSASGFQIGDSGTAVAGYFLSGKIVENDGYAFNFVNDAGSGYIQALIYKTTGNIATGTYSSGSGLDIIVLGGATNNLSSFSRVTTGNAVFLGAWDTGHLVLGSHHLWVDSTSKLRIKSGAPTGDTDGTVVGTQT